MFKSCVMIYAVSMNSEARIFLGVFTSTCNNILKKNVFFFSRNNELHISASYRSLLKPCTVKENDKMAELINKLKRTYTPIKDLIRNISFKSDFNEIDTVGLIFLIEPSITDFHEQNDRCQNFQNVYLTDENKNFICINFWGGIRKHGFEYILKEDTFVAGINLQKRIGNTRKNIPQFRVTELTYFTKTPKFIDTRNALDNLARKCNGIDIKLFCKHCVELKNKIQNFNNYKNVSPYVVNNKTEYNLSKHKIFIESPLAVKPLQNKKDHSLNVTYSDFESTFAPLETNLTPKQILRKQKVNEKIAKLKQYGEPPPLSPINITHKSKNIFKEFKNPLLEKSNVANIENKIPNESPVATKRSPILNKSLLSRNYGNPVRLNFSEKNDVDPFAEELNGSPPLSLE